jgi:hypothetical protein
MGGTYSTYGRYEKRTQNFGLKISWEETAWMGGAIKMTPM